MATPVPTPEGSPRGSDRSDNSVVYTPDPSVSASETEEVASVAETEDEPYPAQQAGQSV